jgi:phenylacetate-CoA ligase
LDFYPSIERSDIQEIKKFQEQKLQELLAYLETYSPFYQRLFKENNINIADIQTLEDLQKIPTTTKNDIQQHNDDFFCALR